MSNNSNPNIYLNLDILRFIPPCRTNRDENNRPKTIIINGGERLFISSQCIKSCLRSQFGLQMDVDKDKLIEDIKECIKGNKEYKEEDLQKSFYLSESFVKDLIKGKDKGGDNVVLFMSFKELVETYKAKKLVWCKKIPAIDIFGRMYASDEDAKTEAVSQIAPAYSVQDVTVLDDLWVCRNSLTDKRGCTTMGNNGLLSSLVYFNANLNLSEILNREYSKETVIDLAKTFTMGMYNLRLNSGVSGTSHNTLPSYCHITIGNVLPLNHSSLFYTSQDKDHVIEESISKLKDKIEKDNNALKAINSFYGNPTRIDSFEFNPDNFTYLQNSLNSMLE